MRIGSLLRLLLAVVLLGWTLWLAGPTAVWAASRAVTPGWLAAALVLTIFDRILNAYRWIALLAPAAGAQRPPVTALLRVFFVSSFLGTFLPASVGGDAVRTIGLNQLNVPAADAFASVFVDRFLGIVSTLVMALVGLLLAGDLAKDPVVVAGLLGTAAVCAVAAALIFSRHAAAAGSGLARRLPGSRVGRVTTSAVTGLQQYASKRLVLLLVLGASIGVQVLRILQAYCIGRALHIELPVSVYFAFIPVILIVIVLPISVSGLGTTQLAFVALFARAGVEYADAFALSVLFLGLGVIGTLPGAVLYAIRPREEARPI